MRGACDREQSQRCIRPLGRRCDCPDNQRLHLSDGERRTRGRNYGAGEYSGIVRVEERAHIANVLKLADRPSDRTAHRQHAVVLRGEPLGELQGHECTK